MKTNNLFIVGAGFDKSVDSCSPLNADLLSKVSENDQEIRELMSKYPVTNDIEKLLTFLDLTDDEDSPRIRLKIQNYLVDYFKQQFRFNPGKIQEWMCIFAKEILTEDDAIVNLNYSCALDGMLDFYEVWSPKGGYSKSVGKLSMSVPDDYPDNMKSPRKRIQIYKIHGSEHFEETCFGDDETKTYVELMVDENIFPQSARHSEFGAGNGKSKGYIIAPSYVKKPHVQVLYMMNEVLARAHTAKTLVIIGCGLRREDVFLWNLVCAFLVKNYRASKYQTKKLIILDPKANSIMQNVKDYFRTEIGGFFAEDGRAIALEGCVHEKINDLKMALQDDVETGFKPVSSAPESVQTLHGGRP